MPIREYMCYWCEFKSERVEFTPDPDPPYCPRCGAHMSKVEFSVPASPQFVGDGWAKDGYSAPKRGPKAS